MAHEVWNKDVLFASKKQDWGTPPHVFGLYWTSFEQLDKARRELSKAKHQEQQGARQWLEAEHAKRQGEASRAARPRSGEGNEERCCLGPEANRDSNVSACTARCQC